MKKSIYFALILIISSFVCSSGQDSSSNDKAPWSISFSYSPKIDLSPYYYYNEKYVSAYNLKTDHKITDKFSFSFGVIYNHWIHNTKLALSDPPGTVISTIKILILEFPVQLNYHLRDSDKKFDPYLKMSINNSYSLQNYYGEAYYWLPTDGPFSYKRSKYCLFYNAGLGTNIKLSPSFSLVAETGVGFALVYYIKKYIFLEGQAGIRYTF